MQYRALGRTGLDVSVLGFGCGNVGGLIVRGTPAERERALMRAVELGVNYFDTAPAYGDGVSERHLGEALKALDLDVYVGTKVRLHSGDPSDIRQTITRSLDESLRRLALPTVDLLHVHDAVDTRREGGALAVRDILDEAVPALEDLRRQGKIKFYGITALGDPDALHQVMDAGTIHTAQVFYNLVNPTAGGQARGRFTGPDFAGLLPKAKKKRIGTIVVRALAGGALSGMAGRHPIAQPAVAPIASGPSYESDARRGDVLRKLAKDGFVSSLVEAAYRFVITNDAVSTVLVGSSTLDHLEQAAAAVVKGPLPPSAMARIAELWQEMSA